MQKLPWYRRPFESHGFLIGTYRPDAIDYKAELEALREKHRIQTQSLRNTFAALDDLKAYNMGLQLRLEAEEARRFVWIVTGATVGLALVISCLVFGWVLGANL